jgi:hypothetical protein
MVIATQNPVTMANRLKPSNALARRFITTTLSDYSAQELRAILIQRGVLPEDAKDMVLTYQTKIRLAKQQQLKPAPTLTNLFRLADKVVQSPGYGANRLEHEMVKIRDTNKRAKVMIEDELTRLRRADKSFYRVGLGTKNNALIQALKELQQNLSQDNVAGADSLTSWYRCYYAEMNRPNNVQHTLFKTNPQRSTQMMVSSLCDLYQLNKQDLDNSLQTALPIT